MPRRIVCYGDSLTWGVDSFTAVAEDARKIGANRFGSSTRWPRVAASVLGNEFEVLEEGLNGRTTIHHDPLMAEYETNGRQTMAAIMHSHKPIDCVVLMLGTNDLKCHLGLTPFQVANGAGILVSDLQAMQIWGDQPNIILVAPPLIFDKLEWGFVGARAKSAACPALYRDQAKARACDYLDASKTIEIPDPTVSGGDGIHLSPQNSIDLGNAIAAEVSRVFERRA